MLGVIQQGSFEFLHLDEPLSIVSKVDEFLAWIYKTREREICRYVPDKICFIYTLQTYVFITEIIIIAFYTMINPLQLEL